MYGTFNRVYRVVVLGLKEGLVEFATVCSKSEVILVCTYVFHHQIQKSSWCVLHD